MDLTTGVVGLTVLCCWLAAQDWAYRSCRERRKPNEEIDRLTGSQRQ
jgi:hypothetical protein